LEKLETKKSVKSQDATRPQAQVAQNPKFFGISFMQPKQ